MPTDAVAIKTGSGTTRLVVAIAAAGGVFVLPLLFPPAHLTMSAAYAAGFNNRVAAVAAAALSLTVFAMVWKSESRLATESYNSEPLSFWWFGAWAFASTVFTIALGALVHKSIIGTHVDLRYFIERMDLVATYHKRIYSDFSFLYGPLLLYLPLGVHWLLQPLHSPIVISYVVALALAQALGLLLLWWVVNALPIRQWLKAWIFALFAVQTLCPMLGMNYTFLRAAFPLAALVLITRLSSPWHSAMAAAIAETLALAISPELGIALAAGAAAYALIMTWRARSAWIFTGIVPVAAAIAFLAAVDQSYLDSVKSLARGRLNLIVEPVPYILIFVAAVVWLAPTAVAERFHRTTDGSAMLASLYVASLALLPAAFGRCDPLHVAFNGLGIYLLSMIAASGMPRRLRWLWAGCVALALLWTVLVNYSLFHMKPAFHWAFYRSPKVVQNAALKLHGGLPGKDWFPQRIDISRLESYVGHSPVATPVWLPFEVEQELKHTGHYLPDYETLLIGVADPQGEAVEVASMNRAEWALLPTGGFLAEESPENSKRSIGFGFNYPERRTGYILGSVIEHELATRWTVAGQIGPFTLYHHRAHRIAG
jgi:hypothetical protein